MESIICVDSSVLINHYREKNKEQTFFYSLVNRHEAFNISVITEYEILIGAKTADQISYWKNIFSDFFILNYTSGVNEIALNISFKLSLKGFNIEFKDLIIAATALSKKIPLATINEKHFNSIEGLQLITPSSLL
ncbi:MAG: type II toxin-antitoxin system VapC family toxin [Chitinophagaceae bacterium]